MHFLFSVLGNETNSVSLRLDAAAAASPIFTRDMTKKLCKFPRARSVLCSTVHVNVPNGPPDLRTGGPFFYAKSASARPEKGAIKPTGRRAGLWRSRHGASWDRAGEQMLNSCQPCRVVRSPERLAEPVNPWRPSRIPRVNCNVDKFARPISYRRGARAPVNDPPNR